MEERLQKILASTGLASRRGCEVYITAGRVKVNGKVAKLGQKADASKDKITVDEKEISVPKTHIYIALNKPRGVISAVSSPVKFQLALKLANSSDYEEKVLPLFVVVEQVI
jgi:23S rRNA pseudouridine2605 synthase